MKHLFTLLLFSIAISSFGQTKLGGDIPDSMIPPTPDKLGRLWKYAEEAKKADSIYDANEVIIVDLVHFKAYQKLQNIDQQRMDLAAQAMVLQEKSKGLDKEAAQIVEAEWQHDPRYDEKREIIFKPTVIGTNLVLVLKKLPVAPVADLKKKSK